MNETKWLLEQLPNLSVQQIAATVGYRSPSHFAAVFRRTFQVNKKLVYQVLKLKGLFVHQRRSTPRPRVKTSKSLAESSDQR